MPLPAATCHLACAPYTAALPLGRSARPVRACSKERRDRDEDQEVRLSLGSSHLRDSGSIETIHITLQSRGFAGPTQ